MGTSRVIGYSPFNVQTMRIQCSYPLRISACVRRRSSGLWTTSNRIELLTFTATFHYCRQEYHSTSSDNVKDTSARAPVDNVYYLFYLSCEFEGCEVVKEGLSLYASW